MRISPVNPAIPETGFEPDARVVVLTIHGWELSNAQQY